LTAFKLRKSHKSKIKRILFITITLLIAIGLVIPLAGLFSNQNDYSGSDNPVTQTPEERLAQLEQKAQANPGDVNTLIELSQAYFYAGNIDQSIKTYKDVLVLEPLNSPARYDLATLYYFSSQYDLSVEQIKELLKNDPNNADAHYLYGIVLGTGVKDYSGAISEMERFIELAREGSDVEKAKQYINEWQNMPVQ
jgi:cytochrome c-type biogenesis protein CcmH/NrfG